LTGVDLLLADAAASQQFLTAAFECSSQLREKCLCVGRQNLRLEFIDSGTARQTAGAHNTYGNGCANIL
jgi:hypothetical protein